MLKVTKVEEIVDQEAGMHRTVVYLWDHDAETAQKLSDMAGYDLQQAYKRVLPEVVAQTFTGKSDDEQAHIVAAAFWSLKAGCSCGCSPGFVLPTVMTETDIHVNVQWEDRHEVAGVAA